MSRRDNRVSVRLSHRTLMQLEEVSSKTGICMSMLIRAFIIREVEACYDENGYYTGLKRNDKRGQG